MSTAIGALCRDALPDRLQFFPDWPDLPQPVPAEATPGLDTRAASSGVCAGDSGGPHSHIQSGHRLHHHKH